MSDVVLRRRVMRLFHALVIGGAALTGGEACKSSDDSDAPQDESPKGDQDAGPDASDDDPSLKDAGPDQPEAGQGSQFW